MLSVDKLLITVAPCIPPYMAHQIPQLDLTPKSIADEVVRAHNAGANILHLHVWDVKGTPIKLDSFIETIRLIREQCDIIIEGSTGGFNDLSPAERSTSLNIDIENGITESRFCQL